jgi:uncharacterized protein (TIGR02271 family)
MVDTTRIAAIKGRPVYANDGDKIGDVSEVYVDDRTNQPEWVSIGTGLFGIKNRLVPIEGAQITAEGVRVPYAKDRVKDAPDVDIDNDHLDDTSEYQLYEHYGIRRGTNRSQSGLPQGRQSTGTVGQGRTGDSMTRSEEEMRIDKRTTQAGQARIRKWVETEPVQQNVNLRRETAQVRRESINEPVREGQIGEQEIEMDLHREEPVVEKRTVAKERIGLEKHTEQESRSVSGEVRRERVDIDTDEPGASQGRTRP